MANLKAVYTKPLASLDDLGQQLAFYIRALVAAPAAAVRYQKEVMRILAEVTLGSGSLAVIGGTVGVIVSMTFFTGAQVGLSGYAALDQIGTAPFAGFASAYFNTREIAPLVAGIALAATVGCGFTAQLGAMRISDEIDALDSMAVRSIPFLATTRLIAAVVCIIPIYLVGLIAAFVATRLVVVNFGGSSAGTYDYYFHLALTPGDLVYSMTKAVVFAIVVALVHCCYGFHASGGPEGVGRAATSAFVYSFMLILAIDLFLGIFLDSLYMSIWPEGVKLV